MTWENIKTLVLVILIGISLLLTFVLWNSPSYNQLTNSSSNSDTVIDEVNLGGGKGVKGTIIEPHHIIFHVNGGYYGFNHPADKQTLYQSMDNWEATDFTVEEAEDEPQDASMVELVFPDAVPATFLSSLFQVNEDVDFPSWSFRQLFISFIPEQQSLKLTIPSIDGRAQATAIVSDADHYNHLWEKLNGLDKDVFRTYLPLEESPYPVYVPEGEIELSGKSVTFNNIDPELLVNVLFTNPSAVSQSYSPEAREVYFTDGQRGLRIFEDGSKMEFVDPYSEDGSTVSPSQLLNDSIYHINGHDGWTDEYHLVAIQPNQQSIRYKMYHDGYPVFNSSNLATIEQVWGSQQLVEYHRPLFKLRDVLSEGSVQLPSGTEVLSYLRNNPDFDLENVQQLYVGYHLNYQSSNQYIELEPAWYMNYNNSFRQLPLDQFQGNEGSD